MNQHHPYVSEVHEASRHSSGACSASSSSPWSSPSSDIRCRDVIIAVTAIVTALLRIIMREKSPWKVRSVLFDAIIGIGLGLGLLLLYFAPSLFWIR